uniref:Speriolin N-terminal domain-containing protein n=1 Tax=Chelydra serpentina TaxID=8475 RepID=A0A8C3SK02_CHESE
MASSHCYERLRMEIHALIAENEELRKLVRLIKENQELKNIVQNQALSNETPLSALPSPRSSDRGQTGVLNTAELDGPEETPGYFEVAPQSSRGLGPEICTGHSSSIRPVRSPVPCAQGISPLYSSYTAPFSGQRAFFLYMACMQPCTVSWGSPRSLGRGHSSFIRPVHSLALCPGAAPVLWAEGILPLYGLYAALFSGQRALLLHTAPTHPCAVPWGSPRSLGRGHSSSIRPLRSPVLWAEGIPPLYGPYTAPFSGQRAFLLYTAHTQCCSDVVPAQGAGQANQAQTPCPDTGARPG